MSVAGRVVEGPPFSGADDDDARQRTLAGDQSWDPMRRRSFSWTIQYTCTGMSRNSFRSLPPTGGETHRSCRRAESAATEGRPRQTEGKPDYSSSSSVWSNNRPGFPMSGGTRQHRVPMKTPVACATAVVGYRAAGGCLAATRRTARASTAHQNPRRAEPPRTPSAVAATARAAAPSCAPTPDSAASADAAEPSVRRANADVADASAEVSVSQ